MTDRDVTVTERLSEQGMADGRTPSKCEQICRTLRRYIGSGHLAAGQQLPAERALSERFATTRITIKEALSSLEADGLIYRAERRGWFVDVKYQADLSPFGFCTRADGGTGWAIRCLRLELQVWKCKKEPRP